MKCLETTVVYVYMYVAYPQRLVASCLGPRPTSCLDLRGNEAMYIARLVELCGASSVLST